MNHAWLEMLKISYWFYCYHFVICYATIYMPCSHAYVVMGRHQMSATGFGKANWKDPRLEKLFIDLCIEEANTEVQRGVV